MQLCAVNFGSIIHDKNSGGAEMPPMTCVMKNHQMVDCPKECPKDCIYLSSNGQACGAPFVFQNDKGGEPGGKFVDPLHKK